jgi:hypothetical protein
LHLLRRERDWQCYNLRRAYLHLGRAVGTQVINPPLTGRSGFPLRERQAERNVESPFYTVERAIVLYQ